MIIFCGSWAEPKRLIFCGQGVRVIHVPLKDVSWLIIIMGLFYVEYVKKLHIKGTLYIKKTLKIKENVYTDIKKTHKPELVHKKDP